MADDLDELEVPENTTRETVADDVRAAIAQAELGDKLANDDTVTETTEQKAERLRDEQGKFVAKDKVEQRTAPDKITDADQPIEQPVQHSRADGPPKGWSADAKTEWSNLPPAIQAAVSRREQEIDAGARQWSEQRQAYERVLTPVAELSQRNGLSVEDGIQRLLSVESRLASDGAATIVELAQAYGVDLVALVNGTPQPQRQQSPQFDPNTIAQTVDQLLEQRLAERDQSNAIQSTIQAFASAPGHEHFDEVKQLMGHLLKSQQASDMQDAYDKATWANPSIRTQLIATQSQPADQGRANQTRRKAAVSLNGAPRGTPAVSRPNGSAGAVIDDVRAAFEQHAGG